MRALVVLFLLIFSCSASAAPSYHMNSIMLMQPEKIFGDRVGSAEKLSDYIIALNGAAERTLSAESSPNPAAGFIVVAVRPGGKSKVWVDFSPAVPLALEARLLGSLQAVTPVSVNGGVIVFAINASLWDAAPTSQQSPQVAEWQQAVKQAGKPLEVGDIVDRVWSSEKSR